MSQSDFNINNIQKSNVFITPDGYFEESQSGILKKVSEVFTIDKELKENIFEVPSLYFEKLSDEIIEKTKKSNQIPFDRFKIIYNENSIALKTLASMAACLLLVISYSFLQKDTDGNCYNYLCDVNNNEIIEYLKTEDLEHSDFMLMDNKINFKDIKTESIEQKIINDTDLEDDLI